MKFHVLTLFPDMIRQGLSTSILGKAQERHLIEAEAVNIRDYTTDKHGKVDDYPYGGGAGMLMQAQPVYDAWKAVCGEKRLRTVYLTPQGFPFTQKMAEDLAKEEELVFLCGHYEGIDERVLEEIVTDYVSIGDYVLTGGELPSMVMIDAISRLVPGVLNNEGSAETESFHNDLLEYPQYSRPEIWHGKAVPGVLMTGDHRKIDAWRLEAACEKTKDRRPDLYQKYEYKQSLVRRLMKNKKENIYLIDGLNSGRVEPVYSNRSGVLGYDRGNDLWMLCADSEAAGLELCEYLPENAGCLLHNCRELNGCLEEKKGFRVLDECNQSVYTKKEALTVSYKTIRELTAQDIAYVSENYGKGEWKEYLLERIAAKAIFGAEEDGRLVGFCGIHEEGSVGMLFVEEAMRGKKIGSSLVAFAMNRVLNRGEIPYAHSLINNEASVKLQEKMGLYFSKVSVFWMEKPEKSEGNH